MATQTVFTATQTTDNVAIDAPLSGFIDEPDIKADEIPRFELRVPNDSGVEGYRLAIGKEISIYRAGERRFPGIVTYCNLEASPPQGRFATVRGIHKGYALLRARVCDSYDFDEDGNPITTRDAVTVNPWHYFVHRKAGGTLDIYGQAPPVDIVRPDEIVECLAGTKFVYQHSFEDNSHLLASQVYAGPTLGTSIIYDDEVVARDFTAFGTPTPRTGAQSKYGVGPDLDGIDDYLENASADFATLTNMSLTASFEIDSLPAAGTYYPIVGVQSSASDVDTNFLLFVKSDGRIAYRQRNSSSDTFAVIGPGQHNITLRRQSNSITIKVDGAEALPASPFTAPALSGVSKLRVGKGYHTGFGDSPALLNGGCYSLRIWNSAIAQATLDTVANPGTSTYSDGTLVGTEYSAWFFNSVTAVGPNRTPNVYRDGETGDLRPKLQRVRNGSTYLAGSSVESIPLESGDPNIDGMSIMRSATLLFVGDYDGSNNPTAEVCFSARASPRTYHAVTLVRTDNYNGSGLASWSGSITLSNPNDSGNSMAYKVTIPGSDGSSISTKIEYAKLTATCDTSLQLPDTQLTDCEVETYVSPAISGISSVEQGGLEIDLQGLNRLDALEKVREMTESDPSTNSSPHWDAWIDDDLVLHFAQRRGTAITNHDYTFASGNLRGLGHEYYGEEIAYQTIAYGSGSGEAQTRIVSQAEFSSGGLYDQDRDPLGGPSPIYGFAARIMDFVDNNEQSVTALLRKARAFHKLHRDPIENVSVEVDAEHLRYFENGDSIRAIDLGTRTNGFLRCVQLRRQFEGGGRERLRVKLGESKDDFAARLADTSGKTETATLRPQPKSISAGLSGNGLLFDRFRYAPHRFTVSPGAKRVKMNVTTVPYQAPAKSVSLLVSSVTPVTGTIGGSAITATVVVPTGVSRAGLGLSIRLTASGAAPFLDRIILRENDTLGPLVGYMDFGATGYDWDNNGNAYLRIPLEDTHVDWRGRTIHVKAEFDGAVTSDTMQVAATGISDGGLKFGIYQFDGDSGTGTGPPVYGTGITFAVDPADADGDGIPTGSEFQEKRIPATLGISTGPQSIRGLDITGYLATTGNGQIAQEHILYLLGAASTDNADGNSAVQVTFEEESEQ